MGAGNSSNMTRSPLFSPRHRQRVGTRVARPAPAADRKRPLFDPPIVRRAMRDAFVEAQPAPHGAKPRSCSSCSSARRTRRSCSSATWRRGAATGGSRSSSRSGSGSRSSSRTSPRRWPRAAARRRRTRCASRARRRTAKRLASADATGSIDRTRYEEVRRDALRRGDSVVCLPGDVIPGDGEVVDGVASVDESAITGESAPVIRESGGRSLGGHRRHESPLRLHRHPHHGKPGRDLPRSHDRARRGRVAAEDAERDRADDSAVRADDRLPLRRRDAAAVRHLQRRRDDDSDPDRAARLPHSDDDRRAALGDRHRGHGSHDPAERDRDERPRRRGGGRREHAAARQDRHDHARQPPGGRSSFPSPGSPPQLLADRAQLASLADETPEGRSIVVLAKTKFGIRAPRGRRRARRRTATWTFIPFSATHADERRRRRAATRCGRAPATPCSTWVREQGGDDAAGSRDDHPARRDGRRHAARRRREGNGERNGRHARACSASSTSRTS